MSHGEDPYAINWFVAISEGRGMLHVINPVHSYWVALNLSTASNRVPMSTPTLPCYGLFFVYVSCMYHTCIRTLPITTANRYNYVRELNGVANRRK